MRRYFLLALRAHVGAGRSLYLLTAFGVALGVASVLSIQILNRNALGAFQGSFQAVSGEADLTVMGVTPTFPERLLPDVLGVEGVGAAWPLYRLDVALASRPDFFLEVVGFDLFAPVRLPVAAAEGSDPAEALSQPGWVAVTPALAAEMGWNLGDAVAVTSGTRRADLRVGALVDFQRLSPLASRRLAVMDIAQAQGLLGHSGRLHQIDVQAAEGVDVTALAERLQRRLGEGLRVATPEQREQQAERLLGAFRLNLTALSLISLFVGMFLVYTSTQASLTRRRGEFGLLRSLGATPRQVVILILGEVALLGALGVVAGLPAGYVVAAANVERVSRTISNLYVLQAIETLSLPPWLWLLAGGVGVGGALAGALLPAVEMSRRDTRALLAAFTLHERVGRAAPRLFAAGVAVLAATLLVYAVLGQGWRPAGFVLAIGLLLSIPLLTPLLVRTLARAARPRSFGAAYSLTSLAVRVGTTSFTVAALAVAVSMMVGITLMVGSFRSTLDSWVRATVRADLYVTSESWARAETEATLDPVLVARLEGRPEVERIDRLRRTTVYVGERRVALAGIDMGLPGGETRFRFLQGDPLAAMGAAASDGAALISEPLMRWTGVEAGGKLSLRTPAGERTLPVAGVFYDYGNENGSVLVHQSTLDLILGPGPPHSLALYLVPGADPERAADGIRAAFSDRPLRIRSNRRLRDEVLQVFDQTFAITRVLQGMGLLVAATGITLTLLILARERTAELALYRALGASRRQIFQVFLGKGISMGLLGMLVGGAGGVALAFILIFVINRAYFGWTIQLAWPWGDLALEALVILAAAAGAALYPAARAARVPAAELSREEVA